MPRISFVLAILTALILGAALTAHAKKNPAVDIVTDEAHGMVRIVIDGHEVVSINNHGLYVDGDIAYSGFLIDGAGIGAALTAQANTNPAIDIVTDEAHKLVRFIIDGKEVVSINNKGLYVNGDIAYLGGITDGGGIGAGLTAPAKTNPVVNIVTDEAHMMVRIVIDGNEVVSINKNGLYVKGDVAYPGVITDTNGAPVVGGAGHAP